MTHGGDWTEREISRFIFRVALFRRRGRPEQNAEDMAERLVERDRERDTRRLCLECSNLQSNGRCFAAQQGKIIGVDKKLEPVRDILQRCEGFEWVTP